MTTTAHCPHCGARYDVDQSPLGLCPACLLGRGQGEVLEDADRRPPPPSLEELAPHFPSLSLHALVGQGGMGAVYRARHEELGRHVALKLLPEELADTPGFSERFRREARLLANLGHPGIVQVHDAGQAGGWFYIVMEFVDGVSLRELMSAGPVAPEKALSLVSQICDALAYAHEQGVIHRDIKPENILIDRDGTVKLVDFGLARLLVPAGSEPNLTVSGQVMGTPHYMAPEQWQDAGKVDQRADIYSLGVVFYELLTQQLPVGRFERPSRKVHIQADIDSVVLKALEADPEQRYQHATEMGTDVDALTVGSAPAAVRDEQEFARRLSKARALTLMLVCTLSVGLVAISTGWFIQVIFEVLGILDTDFDVPTELPTMFLEVVACFGVGSLAWLACWASRKAMVTDAEAQGGDVIEHLWPSGFICLLLMATAMVILLVYGPPDSAFSKSLSIGAPIMVFVAVAEGACYALYRLSGRTVFAGGDPFSKRSRS